MNMTHLKNYNFNSSHGGSFLSLPYIYNFFGSSLDDPLSYSLSKITSLDLGDISSGWISLKISNNNCNDEILQRDSFGLFFNDDYVFIHGGNSNAGFQNSIFMLILDNSEDSQVECEIVSDKGLWPRKRHESSMVYVAGGLYLFGGIDQNFIMNDLWFYNLTDNIWSKESPSGTIPCPRYGHAAASQGNYIVIVGGMTYNNQYLQDYFYYRIDLNSWSEIVPIGELPPPIYRTCLILDFPLFLFIGGRQESEITLDIWQFDFTTFAFNRLYKFNDSTDTPLFKHSCFLNPMNYTNTEIIVGPGSKTISDESSCYIQKLSISKNSISWANISLHDLGIECRTDSIFIYAGYTYLLLLGGKNSNQGVLNDNWIIDFGFSNEKSFKQPPLPYQIYSASYAYVNNSLFIYSGVSQISYFANSLSADTFFILGYTWSSLNNTPCGLGMFFNQSKCDYCATGYYSNLTKAYNCSICPGGTANNMTGATDISQCLPCQYGSKSNSESSECSKCNSSETCYIGTGEFPITSEDSDYLKQFINSNDQPNFYRPKDISNDLLILYIVTLSIICFYILLFLLSHKFRLLLSYYDFFLNKLPQSSNQEGVRRDNSDQTNPPSMLGGFGSGLTLIILAFLTTNSIIAYVKINYDENIVLVPIDSLLQDKNFSSQKISLDIVLPSYGGLCNNSTYLQIFTDEFKLTENPQIKRKSAICELNFKFQTLDVINTGDSINIELSEYLSFTSAIYIRLTAHSSIPGKVSRQVQKLSSDTNMIFRGPIPTSFSFSVLPALYSYKDLYGNKDDKLGYRIASVQLPLAGSQSNIKDLAIYPNLNIEVVFLRSDIGITTFMYPTVGPVNFFFVLINNFPGSIGLMTFILSVIVYIRNRKKGNRVGRFQLFKKKLEEEKIQRRLDKERKEKQSLLHHEEDTVEGVSINRPGLNDSFT